MRSSRSPTPTSLRPLPFAQCLPVLAGVSTMTQVLAGLIETGEHAQILHRLDDSTPALPTVAARLRNDQPGEGSTAAAARRSPEVTRFFDGLDLAEPGLVTAPEWFRTTPAPTPEGSGIYAGVARVP